MAERWEFMVHVMVEAEAESKNVARALAEARAAKMSCKEKSDTFGAYEVEVRYARAAEVKGPRTKAPEVDPRQTEMPIEEEGK